MKRFLIAVLLALLIATVMATAGCGGSDGDADKDEVTVTAPLDVAEDESEGEVEYSAVGTYESDEGKFITLNADGTFETDDWDDMKEGTYAFTQDQDGYYWVELTFEDGSLAVLSVMISMDEVAAIADDFTLVQYTKK